MAFHSGYYDHSIICINVIRAAEWKETLKNLHENKRIIPVHDRLFPE